MSGPYRFGKRSRRRLGTCDVRLQRLFVRVVSKVDCTILCGHRDQEAQDQAVREERSRTPWPTSNHNDMPSRAVDVVPYPIDWEDLDRMREFGTFVEGVAYGMGISIRWGGRWTRLVDMPHWEIVGE